MTGPQRSPIEILECFTDHNNPPILLNEEEQTEFKRYMAKIGLKSVFGCSELIGNTKENLSSIALLLSYDSRAMVIANYPGSILGPYFVGEKYYECGISVYMPEASQSNDL
jgi:hypothetical protein